MSLDELLHALRSTSVVLAFGGRGRIVPAFPVSWRLRQAIRDQNAALKQLILFSDHRVCPSPDLHRASWYHAGQQVYRCKVCARLLASIWSYSA